MATSRWTNTRSRITDSPTRTWIRFAGCQANSEKRTDGHVGGRNGQPEQAGEHDKNRSRKICREALTVIHRRNLVAHRFGDAARAQ